MNCSQAQREGILRERKKVHCCHERLITASIILAFCVIVQLFAFVSLPAIGVLFSFLSLVSIYFSLRKSALLAIYCVNIDKPA